MGKNCKKELNIGEAIMDLLINAFLDTISDIVESRDNTTTGHISRMSSCLEIMVDAVLESGLYKEETSSWDKKQIVMAGKLHDIGKISID
jgi:putative two-component system response regulator